MVRDVDGVGGVRRGMWMVKFASFCKIHKFEKMQKLRNDKSSLCENAKFDKND
jgi:hypothetical protein